MKSISKLYRLLTFSALSLFVVGMLMLPNTASAQARGSVKLSPVKTVADLQQIEAGDLIVMSCPKCKDTYATIAVTTLRGHTPEELKPLAQHLCSSCETKFTFDGKGKLSETKLVHSCKACGSEDVSCYVMKKQDLSTHGEKEHK